MRRNVKNAEEIRVQQKRRQKDAKSSPSGPPYGVTHKRRRKRRLSAFAYALIAVTFACVALVLVSTAFLKVQTITVSGGSYTKQQVAAASGISAGDNILSINRKAVASRLTQNLPYIKSAQVSVKPLSTVIIKITPDEPAGVIQYSGGYAVVDSEMKVLELRKDLKGFEALPLIKGVSGTSQEAGQKLSADQSQIELVGSISKYIEENKIGNINCIDISDSYDITVTYDKRIDILIGTSSDLSYKFKMAQHILSNKISPSEKGDLDVSNVGQAIFSPA
jgi:cell division septal protein FtsQ